MFFWRILHILCFSSIFFHIWAPHDCDCVMFISSFHATHCRRHWCLLKKHTEWKLQQDDGGLFYSHVNMWSFFIRTELDNRLNAMFTISLMFVKCWFVIWGFIAVYSQENWFVDIRMSCAGFISSVIRTTLTQTLTSIWSSASPWARVQISHINESLTNSLKCVLLSVWEISE